jgi:hypothetical protein
LFFCVAILAALLQANPTDGSFRRSGSLCQELLQSFPAFSNYRFHQMQRKLLLLKPAWNL